MLRLGALVLCFLRCGFAQQTSATLTGSITDPSGAMVPDVIVKAVNLSTNLARAANTDASGTIRSLS